MPSRQSRRWFLAGAAMGGARAALSAFRSRCTGAAPETGPSPSRDSWPPAPRPCTGQGTASRRRLHRGSLCAAELSFRRHAADGDGISAGAPVDTCPWLDVGRRLTVLAGRPCGLLGNCVPTDSTPKHHGFGGARSRNKLHRRPPSICSVSAMAAYGRARPSRRSTGRGILRSAKPSASPPVRSTRLGLRPIRQPCRRNVGHVVVNIAPSSLVELFLLHGGRQCRFLSQESGGDQAPRCAPSSGRPTSAMSNRSGQGNDGRKRLLVRVWLMTLSGARYAFGGLRPETPSVLRFGSTKSA